ncbi:chromosome partition protein MukE [Morganella morganii]|uniref:chromosome partition protein MukE n=1 Tax=Morganella morganii TaxID=582 RepID=UPI00164B9407|nr:chromosome partition protein MukE [Morganella morganii]MBC4012197.1 chromosome partition protein MukE [Morganella morganii]
MSSTHIEQFMSAKLAQALANNLFPELDSQLRAGRHIGVDDLDNHAFLMDFQDELEGFYARYNVELVRAPEGFFYLRPRSTTLIPRSVLSELEMLVGKVLCYLYLSPERLANQGIFSTAELYEELLSLADEAKLLKVVNNRSTGSDLDKQKLLEKTRGALNRLRRLGMITFVSADNSQFVIAESVFRFGADVRSGDNPREAQLRLIRDGEAQSLTEDEKPPRPEDQDDDNEESDNDNATDEAEDEE